MSFWSKLFGSDNVVQAGIKGLDAMVFTDEEKSNAKLAFLKAYEPFKLAQRLLMLIVSIPYMICWVATFISSAWGADISNLTAMLNGDIGSVFILIVGFYFGGGMAEGAIRAYVGKGK